MILISFPSLLRAPQIEDPQTQHLCRTSPEQHKSQTWTGGPSPELGSALLLRQWAGVSVPAVASATPPAISVRLEVGVSCPLHPTLRALLGARRQICQRGLGGRAGAASGRGLRSSRIKRSESTIFHCRQSQPRHQLLGQSSLKSLLILFLPLHFFFFSPFLAGVLDKASPPPLLPLPQPTQETGLPKEGLKPEAAGWGRGGGVCVGGELHVCALCAHVWLGGTAMAFCVPVCAPGHHCGSLEVCILWACIWVPGRPQCARVCVRTRAWVRMYTHGPHCARTHRKAPPR